MKWTQRYGLLLMCLWSFALQVLSDGTTEPFVGRIETKIAIGGDLQYIVYTAGTNMIRIERTDTDRPWPLNLMDRTTGERTILYPHNRSYIKLKEPTPNRDQVSRSGFPGMPAIMATAEPRQLVATGDTTNLLGFTCERFEIKQGIERMTVYAADIGLSFASWRQHAQPALDLRGLEEQWGSTIAGKNMFPLQAVLIIDDQHELLRYDVTSITTQKTGDQLPCLFVPPPDYQEISPPTLLP